MLSNDAFLAASLVLVVLHIGPLPSAAEATSQHRQGKIFNVFQIVRFQNGPCAGGNNMNGTCYTQAECESRGGTNGGTCASGFGVCCIFTVACGGMSNENCTIFSSGAGGGTVMAGGCQATICPCSSNICQLRLDFNNFVITGPNTLTVSVAMRKAMSGVVIPGGNVAVNRFTQCSTDTFSVSNPDGPNPPAICGTNSGEHMYVEASDDCNTLSFVFGATGVGATIATRQFSIKVTQFSCDFPNLAPQGCTQYFFGPMSGSVRSFNYAGGNGIHLANQDQRICVRRERGLCRLCWTTVMNNDFGVSGMTNPQVQLSDGVCCSFAGANTAISGFDCVQIPGAVQFAAPFFPMNSNVCGNNMGLAAAGSICTTLVPFSVNFLSDNFEVQMEADPANTGQAGNQGFALVYVMDAIGCNAAAMNN